MDNMWNLYTAKLTVDRLVAGLPSHGKMIDAWLGVNNAPEGAEVDIKASAAQLEADTIEQHTVVFYRNPVGIACYESRCFKGALKEAANVCKDLLGKKAYRAKLAERVFAGPRLLPIISTIQVDERPISVMTAQGPRTSIKRFEFAENVDFTFDIKILNDKVFGEDDIRSLLEYMQENGIGADRSQGNGTFTLHSFGPK